MLVIIVLLIAVACSSGVDDVSTTSASETAPVDDADDIDDAEDDGTSSYDESPNEELPQEGQPAEQAPSDIPPMQNSDEVHALLEAWRQDGPSDYHYEADVFMLSLPAAGESPEVVNECGSRGGRVVVEVADRNVVEAQVPGSTCVIDLASPTRLPLTGEEILAMALDIVRDLDVASVEVNEVGFPTSVYTESRTGVLEFSLRSFELGAGNRVPARDEAARLARARARWDQAANTSYFIEVERVCRCAPPYRGRFTVRVDGDVATATVDGAPLSDDLDASSFTVEGLFSAIEAWADADLLQVAYDDARGIPIRINVDPAAGIADDEVTLVVTRFLSDNEPYGDLELLLRDYEAAVDEAPVDAITLGDATFCGFDDVALNSDVIGGNPIGRACFTSRVERSEPAVLVQRAPTAEGDPIITVFRSRADGSLTQHVDSTQDEFGSAGWASYDCAQIEDRSDLGPNFFVLRC